MFPVYFLVDVLFVSLNHHAFGIRDPSAPFSFPFQAVCPLLFFSVFGDCQIPRRHPAAFVVDKFFPSASSPHCLLSTNAVVGRAFTYSMFSFHNSPRFIPTSCTISQAHSCLSTLSRLPPCRFQSPFQSMLSRLKSVWSYLELDCRRRRVTLHLASVTSRS